MIMFLCVYVQNELDLNLCILLFFILFFLFLFFYLVKIDKLFIKKKIRCWCGIFYNILIPPLATSDISIGWLTERMKITRVNWFMD